MTLYTTFVPCKKKWKNRKNNDRAAKKNAKPAMNLWQSSNEYIGRAEHERIKCQRVSSKSIRENNSRASITV